MPIDITVEDGTNVANANAYVNVADARTYAERRGITLNASDDTVASFLIRSTDYLNGLRERYKGYRTYITGMMQWPREAVQIDNLIISNTTIPSELIAAQCQLVIALNAGIPIDSPIIGGVLPVIREKIGPIETEYATPAMLGGMRGTDWNNDRMPAVDALLAPLFAETGTGFRVFRV